MPCELTVLVMEEPETVVWYLLTSALYDKASIRVLCVKILQLCVLSLNDIVSDNFFIKFKSSKHLCQ